MDNAPAKHLTVNTKGKTILLIPRVSRFIELLVAGEHKFEDAAKEAGLRLKRARMIMTDPAIRRHYFKQCEVVSESERARNIRLRRVIRDRAMADDAPAALAKVGLEAAKQLDGDDQGGTTNHFNGPTVIAGYVIKLDGPSAGPRVIGNGSPQIEHQGRSDAKPLADNEDVGE